MAQDFLNQTENCRMERLHLREINDTIDILYRPLHTYILFVPNNEEGKAKVKELATMSRYEFAKFLATVRALPKCSPNDIMKYTTGHEEEWYQNAWKQSTKTIFKDINVENPIEEPIWFNELELIRHPEKFGLDDEEDNIEKGTTIVEDI